MLTPGELIKLIRAYNRVLRRLLIARRMQALPDFPR